MLSVFKAYISSEHPSGCANLCPMLKNPKSSSELGISEYGSSPKKTINHHIFFKRSNMDVEVL